MSTPYSKWYQKCDVCHDSVAVDEGRSLPALVLPAAYWSMEGSKPSVDTVKISVCQSCMEKVHSWIRKKYMIDEIEYSGTTVKVIDEELD